MHYLMVVMHQVIHPPPLHLLCTEGLYQPAVWEVLGTFYKALAHRSSGDTTLSRRDIK